MKNLVTRVGPAFATIVMTVAAVVASVGITFFILDTFGNGVEPLCTVYHQDCIKMIENQIRLKRYKVSDFFDHVHVKIKQVPKGQFTSSYDLFNINTPEDVEKAEIIMKNLENGK